MRTSFHHQSEAQPPNGPLTAAPSPDTPSICPARQSVSRNGVKVASGRSPDRSRVHPVPQSSQGSNSFPPAAIAALSNCMRCAARLKIEGARVAVGRQGMDASLFIGAPLGFGILLALGILMVAMSYLSQ
jgi:hypothetical protein